MADREVIKDELEILYIECGRCKEKIAVKWQNGIHSEPHFVLIADWIFHTKCWDRIVFEHSYPEVPGPHPVQGNTAAIIITDDLVPITPLNWEF